MAIGAVIGAIMSMLSQQQGQQAATDAGIANQAGAFGNTGGMPLGPETNQIESVVGPPQQQPPGFAPQITQLDQEKQKQAQMVASMMGPGRP